MTFDDLALFKKAISPLEIPPTIYVNIGGLTLSQGEKLQELTLHGLKVVPCADLPPGIIYMVNMPVFIDKEKEILT